VSRLSFSPRDDRQIVADEPCRLLGIRLDDEVRDVGVVQPLDQSGGDTDRTR
jgi:hypothetical protein